MKTELFRKAKFSSSLLKVVMSLVLVASPFSLVGSALAAPVDSSVPATSITTPTNNSTVSGVVAVSASATDVYSSCVVTVSGQSYDVSSLKSDHSGGDIFVCGTDMTAVYQAVHGTSVSRIASFLIPSTYNGVTQVELYVDNSLVSTDVSTPYSFSLDTTSLSNGVHVLTAKAYDQAGNVGTSTNVSVTVNNAVVTPVLTSVSLNPATSSVVVGGTQQYTAVAKDQNG
ncbi:MAG: Ig-like domain-containing protein, partial [Candidatus Magasanikiibacteriota bacterium]